MISNGVPCCSSQMRQPASTDSVVARSSRASRTTLIGCVAIGDSLGKAGMVRLHLHQHDVTVSAHLRERVTCRRVARLVEFRGCDDEEARSGAKPVVQFMPFYETDQRSADMECQGV